MSQFGGLDLSFRTQFSSVHNQHTLRSLNRFATMSDDDSSDAHCADCLVYGAFMRNIEVSSTFIHYQWTPRKTSGG